VNKIQQDRLFGNVDYLTKKNAARVQFKNNAIINNGFSILQYANDKKIQARINEEFEKSWEENMKS